MSIASVRRIAVGQICSSGDVVSNLAACTRLMREAAQGGAKVLFLPEAADYIGESKEQSLSLAQDIEGPFVQSLRSAAKELALWLSVCFHEKIPNEPRIFNTHLLIDETGSIAGTYRKLHLFDVNIEGGPRLMESEGVKPGAQFVEPIQTPVGSIGLSTCYDLRFPELSLMLRNHGAQILTYPSAFTVKTGEAHWGFQQISSFLAQVI